MNGERGMDLAQSEITALAFKTGVDAPERFAKSKTMGAHFGLTSRKFNSGEIDYNGHISKCGDAMVRTLLYEAANAMLIRCARYSALKAWPMRIAKTRGLKRAKVASLPNGGACWRVGCVTVGPFGEGTVVKIRPIPCSVMIHACSIVASRIGAAGYKLMRSLARDMELIARPALGTKA